MLFVKLTGSCIFYHNCNKFFILVLFIAVPSILSKTIEAAPYIITPLHCIKYAKVGDDLNVSVDVAVFGTVHFQLIHHYTKMNASTKRIESGVKIMNTPRKVEFIGPVTTLSGGKGAIRYRVTFMFKNLTEFDFGSYNIMAGNSFGYDASQLKLTKRRHLPVVL